MKLGIFNSFAPVFKGKREDRNTTNQLKNDNDYALTSNNQIKITNAIKNLGRQPGESNVKFLLDVAGNLKYGTNIQNGKEPNNDWKSELKQATESSAAISDPIVREKYIPEIDKVFNDPKPLTEDEKDILKSQDYILSKVDKNQLDEQTNPNIKHLESNMSYFVVSSEVPIKQKKYVMGRLAHLMSPEYKINPQLKDKKTQVVAEMMNDLVVSTKESKVPNTKAINQKHHGMCAAISIARKLMSYEDKPNYVDNIMSELDDSPNLMVYDKTQIGKNVKVPVEKAYVNFEDADKKGYRIVDASTTQWMNVSDMYGADSVPKSRYTPFDRDNFGAFDDTHFVVTMDDKKLAPKHNYYQALIKARNVIGEAKKSKVEHEVKSTERRDGYDKTMEYIQKSTNLITSNLKELVPTIDDKEYADSDKLQAKKSQQVTTKLLGLMKDTSEQINDGVKDGTAKYHFIPNEESSVKSQKIKSYLTDTFGDRLNQDKLDLLVDGSKNDSELTGIADGKESPRTGITELVENVHELNKDINPESKISKKVAEDRKLFEAAVAYRAQAKITLNDPDYLVDRMIENDVPDNETLLSENLGHVAAHIEKTGDPVYVKHFAEKLALPEDKDQISSTLRDLKGGIDHYMSAGMDEVYQGLGLGNRKQSLAYQVMEVHEQIKAGDKESLGLAAMSLKMKPDKNKIANIYDGFQKTLLGNPTNKEYSEIYNKTGNKDQIGSFIESFNIVNNAFVKPEDNVMNKTIISAFNASHGIEGDTPTEKSYEELNKVADTFNKISNNASFIRNLMNVTDEKGNLINTAEPAEVVLKKMESKGEVISAKELTPLRDRFDKLDKLRSQDEFSSRQGKISDPTLYKFSNPEKETIRKIDKSLNKMYSEVNKELAFTKKDIKEPLEEHMRKIGVDEGFYWLPEEGESGLFSSQQAKILQQMTDRPYHETEDKEKSFDIVKNTPHSGISGTSVFHDKQGGHAQYVAEISPAGNENKEVLYHDNSWGASELENTWKGSDGLTHTDYSDNRGGETGYITNDKWRNGNYTDDLMTKTGEIKTSEVTDRRLKKLSSDRDGYKFPLMRDMIIPGDDGKVKRVASSIKFSIFSPDTSYIPNITKLAGEMTQDEIKAAIVKHKTAAKDYDKTIDKIDERIDKTPFNKGINTKDEFDALDDADPVKVVFEKTAFARSFPDGANWKDLAQAKTVGEIHSFEAQRKKNARSYFDYSFGKEPEVLLSYALDKDLNKTLDIVSAALEKHNIKLDDDKKVDIIRSTAGYEKSEKNEFDGSLKHTIGFMVNKTLKHFDTVVPPSEDANLAKQEIKENLTNSLSDALYFKESDADNTSTKFKALSKYIDRKYSPETNEDFAKVYRNMQDMTTEEFKKETSDIKDEELGIKGYTGYDMLKSYKSSDPKTSTTMRNLVFQQSLLKDIKLSDTKPVYKYNKLYKNHQADSYPSGRTFDDLYRSFSNSMVSLDYAKLFNKNKDSAFRKYGAVPAYPKTSVISQRALHSQMNSVQKMVFENVEIINSKKGTIDGYNMTDTLAGMIDKIPPHSKVTTKQALAMNNIAAAFVTRNYNEASIIKSLKSAQSVILLTPGSTGADYRKAFAPMRKEIGALKKMNPPEAIQNSIRQDVKVLKISLNASIVSAIPERHQHIIKKDLNDWISEELKPKDTDNNIAKNVEKISKKINDYSAPRKNLEYTKSAYLGGLTSDLSNIYNTKLAVKQTEVQDEEQNEYFKSDMGQVLMTLVPDTHKEKFTKSVLAMINTNKRLSQEDVTENIHKQLSKYSKLPQDELAKNEDVQLLSQTVTGLNSLQNDLKDYDKNIDATVKHIGKSTSDFVDKNITPEHKMAVASMVDDVVSSSLADKPAHNYNLEKAAVAHDKFVNDFEKHNSLQYPQEFLNRYLLLAAKDGPVKTADGSIKSQAANAEFKIKSTGLSAALEHATLMDIQESLMESVDTGNEAAVGKKFSNFDSGLMDPETGHTLSLGDDKAIDYMTRRMVIGEDNDTAVMFINKLGLAVPYLRAENDLLDPKLVKKDVNKMVNILGITTAQVATIEKITEGLVNPDFDNDKNYVQKIDEAKAEIIEKTKKMTRQKSIKVYLQALDNAKGFLIENPNISKSIMVKHAVNQANSAVAEEANYDIQGIQADINAIMGVYNIVSKINVNKGSEADNLKNAYFKKHDEIENYMGKALTNVSNNSKLDIKLENLDGTPDSDDYDDSEA